MVYVVYVNKQAPLAFGSGGSLHLSHTKALTRCNLGLCLGFVTFVQQVAATSQLLQFPHFWHFWTIHSSFSSLMLFEYRILHWSWDQSSVVLRPLSRKNNRRFSNRWFNNIDRFYSIDNVNIDNYHHLQTLSLQELNSPSCRSCALADKRIGIQ